MSIRRIFNRVKDKLSIEEPQRLKAGSAGGVYLVDRGSVSEETKGGSLPEELEPSPPPFQYLPYEGKFNRWPAKRSSRRGGVFQGLCGIR
jgi:hypothetical protein